MRLHRRALQASLRDERMSMICSFLQLCILILHFYKLSQHSSHTFCPVRAPSCQPGARHVLADLDHSILFIIIEQGHIHVHVAHEGNLRKVWNAGCMDGLGPKRAGGHQWRYRFWSCGCHSPCHLASRLGLLGTPAVRPGMHGQGQGGSLGPGQDKAEKCAFCPQGAAARPHLLGLPDGEACSGLCKQFLAQQSPQVHVGLEGCAQFASPAGGQLPSRVKFRDISIRVKGNKAAWLVDIRAYPDLPHTFATLDECGMSRDLHSAPSKGDPAVLLAPNAVYPITLLLDTLDGPHRRYSPSTPTQHNARSHNNQGTERPCSL